MMSKATNEITDQMQDGTQNEANIMAVLNENYALSFKKLEFLRDSGCMAYAAYAAEGAKYFLRITKPAFFETSAKSLDIHLFLQKQGFPVPAIVFTGNGSPCVQIRKAEGDCFFILYEYVEGGEADPVSDAEHIGAFVGRLHHVMKKYSGGLIRRDKHFYIGRYIDQMRAKQYDKVNEFFAYGEALWERVKELPRGYCHGDLYCGNILKTPDGRYYLLDFDTSCEGFPLYDPALICNRTDFFDLEEDGLIKCKEVYERFLAEYLKHNSVSNAETAAFYDLIALYHFALQATIIEIFGLDCVDSAFLDKQLRWLYQWREQCMQNGVWTG